MAKRVFFLGGGRNRGLSVKSGGIFFSGKKKTHVG